MLWLQKVGFSTWLIWMSPPCVFILWFLLCLTFHCSEIVSVTWIHTICVQPLSSNVNYTEIQYSYCCVLYIFFRLLNNYGKVKANCCKFCMSVSSLILLPQQKSFICWPYSHLNLRTGTILFSNPGLTLHPFQLQCGRQSLYITWKVWEALTLNPLRTSPCAPASPGFCWLQIIARRWSWAGALFVKLGLLTT